MEKLPVKIKLSRDMSLPAYATPGAAALDLRAALDPGQTVTLAPGDTFLFCTGVSVAPQRNDVVAILAARSGLSTKYGISLANGIGVIDSDYRGELCVPLHNFGNAPYTVSRGDRIAQLLFLPVLSAQFELVTELDETDRGTGGFGSTGLQ